MAKPTAQEITALSEQIITAAALICGSCSVAAVALIQAQAKLEAHVLDEHAADAGCTAFEADIARLKAAAVRALEKARAERAGSTDIKTNSAGGNC